MLLTETEGKDLFKRAGLKVPKSILVSSLDQLRLVTEKKLQYPLYAKAQVLHGNRELQDLVVRVEHEGLLHKVVEKLLAATDQYHQQIPAVLLEEAVAFDNQVFLSMTYDTSLRKLVAYYSPRGGVGMDDRAETLEVIPLSVLSEPALFPPNSSLLGVVQKLWQLMLEQDAVLIEINPLVIKDDQIYCLDAKVMLEDAADFRHEEWSRYPERSAMGRPPTELELKAGQVSNMDHRGAAGESFFEFLGGEVGVLASGGGASQLAMDALMSAGVSPANYTEYSGNPTREKVKALTEVVLSIPNLKGLYVVGSNANFTDIFETLSGVIDGLLNSQYQNEVGFSVLIRRGGPRWEDAFAMVNERLAGKNFKVQLFGPDFPVVDTALEMKRMITEGIS